MRVAATLGGEVRTSRLRRELTLTDLGELVGIGPTRLHEIEVGRGESAPLALWFALGSALGRPFAASLSRDLVGVGGPGGRPSSGARARPRVGTASRPQRIVRAADSIDRTRRRL